MLYEKKKINLKQLIKIVYPNFIRRCIQFYAFLFFTFSLKAQTQSAYFIGNSVTDAINLDGLKEIVASTGGSLSTGRHMIPGAPLDWIFTHPKDGFSNDPYGLYPNALPNNAFTNVSFQPFDRRELEDGPIIDSFIKLAGNNASISQYFIYQRWPRTPNSLAPTDPSLSADTWSNLWTRTYTGPGKWDGTEESRGYFETLTNYCRNNISGIKKMLMVPVGEVMYRLNLKMKAGQVAGYTDIWDVYSDGIHLTTEGGYIPALTYYATFFKADPRGTSVPARFGTISTAFVTAVQQTVWEVISSYVDNLGNNWSGYGSQPIISVSSVSVTPISFSLVAGVDSTIIATILPTNASNKQVIWSSSNESIAVVSSSGIVTGISAGTAIIKATSVDGAKEASSTVTVTASSVAIPVQGLSITPANALINPNETLLLKPIFTPLAATNKAITWTSSANEFATVNNTGLVTAIKSGNVTISAKTIDGGFISTSTIRVNGAPIAKITSNIITGNAPLTVNFSASGSTDPDAGDFILGYDWDFGDNTPKSNANSPTHTFNQPGTYIVKLKVMDNNNLYSNIVDTTIIVTGSTGGETGTQATINFTNVNTGNLPNPYNDPSGYTLSGESVRGGAEPLNIISNNGNNVVINSNWNSRINLSKTDGGKFNLISLMYGSDPWGGLADATIIGTTSIGGTLTANISSSSTTLQKITLDWKDVTKVVIAFDGGANDGYGMIDDIVLSSGTVLPVDFKTFDIRENNNTIQLNWIVANEVNLLNYEIEKSNDGRVYKTIGNVNALGVDKYTFTDKDLEPGVCYYRIKAINNDGSFKYSVTKSITHSNSGRLAYCIFPNPASNVFVIKNLTGTNQITLVDASGKVLLTRKNISNGVATLSISTLQNGIYSVIINNGEENTTLKLIIKK